MASGKSVLSEEMLKIIHGDTSVSKEEQYNASLQRWWHQYASRKNDEEEEHVADSLLYDERCHLPRTTPKPEFTAPETAPKEEAKPAAAPSSS